MPVPDELPSTLQRCDREQGGCGTPFSVTLDSCPHCHRQSSRLQHDWREGAPAIDEKPTAGSEDGEPVTNQIDGTSEGDETSRDSAPELETGPSTKAYGKPPKR